MAGLSSRRKGANAERELAQLLTEHGFEARRDGRLQADLAHNLKGTHVEVKRSEKPTFLKWCDQAERDAFAFGFRSWAVFWRASRRPWTVTIPVEEFVRLKLLEARRAEIFEPSFVVRTDPVEPGERDDFRPVDDTFRL